MAQSKEQITRLVKQYPVIGGILNARQAHAARLGDVTIKVQKLDPTFLYMIPRSHLGESGSIHRSGSGLIGAQQVYVYVVHDVGDKKPLKWDGFDRANERTILEEIMWLPEELRSKCLYFVVYSVTNWFVNPTRGERHDGIYFGDYRKTEIDFSVHLVPVGGLSSVITEAHPAKNVELNSRLMTYGALLRGSEWKDEQANKFKIASVLLKVYAKHLEKHVLVEGGLKKFADESNGSVKGRCGPIVFSTVAMAGRFQIMLSNANCEAYFLGGDSNDYPLNLSVNSLFATVPQVKGMVDQFVKSWRQVPADQRIEKFSIQTG